MKLLATKWDLIQPVFSRVPIILINYFLNEKIYFNLYAYVHTHTQTEVLLRP